MAQTGASGQPDTHGSPDCRRSDADGYRPRQLSDSISQPDAVRKTAGGGRSYSARRSGHDPSGGCCGRGGNRCSAHSGHPPAHRVAGYTVPAAHSFCRLSYRAHFLEWKAARSQRLLAKK